MVFTPFFSKQLPEKAKCVESLFPTLNFIKVSLGTCRQQAVSACHSFLLAVAAEAGMDPGTVKECQTPQIQDWH